MHENKLLTTKEICAITQVNASTVWRWRQEGMPYIQIGRSIRFDRDAVTKWFIEKAKNA